MSAQFGADYLRAFRERGGKVVTMRVGNDYVIDIERAMFNKPSGFLFSGAPYEAVWIPSASTTSKRFSACSGSSIG